MKQESAMEVMTENIHPGFQFDNYARNKMLVEKGMPLPKFFTTGTTIAGIVYEDGVVLGADTRATSGNIIADKCCNKIHYLQPNMYCCGAGTAADLDITPRMISSKLELHRLHTGRQVPVVAANQMLKQYLFRYQGHMGVALIVGGVDKHGSHVYTIHPHGSSDRIPYTTMGSGCLAAMSVFESRWKPNMKLEEAKQLVRDAIAAGILNDLASGSNVDLCVINKDGAQLIQPHEVTESKGVRQGEYKYSKGTTEVLKMIQRPIEIFSETVVPVSSTTEEEAMDTA